MAPGNAPDERHHYAYIKYVAEHPAQFPPRLEDIRTGQGEPNHLTHPPLYYQVLAIPYHLLNLDNQLTSIGRSNDEFGALSTRLAIPPLRSVSYLFALAHLAGLFLLLRYFVRTSLLREWMAVVAAACLALVPSFILIAGAVTNDVLALALWPFLVLTTLHYARVGHTRHFYLAVVLVSMAVLTKATLWLLAAAATILIVGTVLTGYRQRPIDTSTARWLWLRVRPTRNAEWLLLSVSLLTVGAAITTFASNIVRYGSIQPGYSQINGLNPTETKFFIESPEPMAVLDFASLATTRLLRSLVGVLTHQERIFVSQPERLSQVALILTLVAVAIVGWRTINHARGFAYWTTVGLIGVPLLYLILLVGRLYSSYNVLGRVAGQGRYLIGYLGLWVLGILTAASVNRLPDKAHVMSWFSSGGRLVLAGALVWLLVDPTFYLARTTELHRQAEIERLVAEQAHDRGMSQLSMTPVGPENLKRHGRRTGAMLPSPRWLMAWQGSQLSGDTFAHKGSCREVWVYGRGDRGWEGGPQLRIDLRASGDSISDAAVELPSHPEVVRRIMPVSTTGHIRITLTQRSASDVARPGFNRELPRSHFVEVFAVYEGPHPC